MNLKTRVRIPLLAEDTSSQAKVNGDPHVIEELIVREFVRLQLNDVKHVCLGLIRGESVPSSH